MSKTLLKYMYKLREAIRLKLIPSHYIGNGGYPTTPGSKTNQELSTLETPNFVTSRRWYPSPKPEIDAVITVTGGPHRANGIGSFVDTDLTVDASFRFIETRDEASDEYSTTTTVTETIGDDDYVFSVTTKVDPATLVDYWLDIDGDQILDVEGNPIEVIQT